MVIYCSRFQHSSMSNQANILTLMGIFGCRMCFLGYTLHLCLSFSAAMSFPFWPECWRPDIRNLPANTVTEEPEDGQANTQTHARSWLLSEMPTSWLKHLLQSLLTHSKRFYPNLSSILYTYIVFEVFSLWQGKQIRSKLAFWTFTFFVQQ